MNVRELEAWLKRGVSIKDESERSKALDSVIIELRYLKTKHVSSYWDAAAAVIDTFTDPDRVSWKLRKLAYALEFMKPKDRSSRLQGIEERARSFSDKDYYGFHRVFDGLAYGGIRALPSLDAIQRFDQYSAEVKIRLLDKPELLSGAIGALARAISGLPRSQRTRCYDDLNNLAQSRLGNEPPEYGNAIVGLSEALRSLPLADILERARDLRQEAENLSLQGDVRSRECAELVLHATSMGQSRVGTLRLANQANRLKKGLSRR
jgi:hypothetical protein